MTQHSSDSGRPVPTRRWRFGLRRLFVALTLLALACGWASHIWRREMAWRQATAGVREAGGSVAWFSGKSRAAKFAASIDLGNSKIDDDGLKDLSRFPNAVRLSLRNTAVTDAGVEHLRNLKALRSIDLRGAKVSPEGVAELRRLLPQADVSY